MSVTYQPAEPWTGRSDPEDGPGAVRLHHLQQADTTRGLIGFACDAGVARNKGRVGAKEAPHAIRQAMRNLAAPEAASGFTDLGTIAVEDDDLETGQSMLSNQIAGALDGLDRLVVLGGGHETAFGSYSGLKQKWPDKRIGIINLDAHLDLRAIGDAGPSSGTPFYQIHALDPDRFDYLCLGIAEEANTAALIARAAKFGVTAIHDHELARDTARAEQEIDAVFARNDLVYLTIDMDVLPHAVAPGVSAPAARGVSLATIEALVDHVLIHARTRPGALPLADIVEVCPRFDQDGVTARVAANLARKLLLK